MVLTEGWMNVAQHNVGLLRRGRRVAYGPKGTFRLSRLPLRVPSVVFHAVLVLFRAFRARVTFSMIVSTVAVQTKGFGAALWYVM